MKIGFKVKEGECVLPTDIFSISTTEMEELVRHGSLYLAKSLATQEPTTFLRFVKSESKFNKYTIIALCGNSYITYHRDFSKGVRIAICGDSKELYSSDIFLYMANVIGIKEKLVGIYATSDGQQFDTHHVDDWYLPPLDLDTKAWLSDVLSSVARASNIAKLRAKYLNDYGSEAGRVVDAINSKNNANPKMDWSTTTLSKIAPYKEDGGNKASGSKHITGWYNGLSDYHKRVINKPLKFKYTDMVYYVVLLGMVNTARKCGLDVNYKELARMPVDEDVKRRIVGTHVVDDSTILSIVRDLKESGSVTGE